MPAPRSRPQPPRLRPRPPSARGFAARGAAGRARRRSRTDSRRPGGRRGDDRRRRLRDAGLPRDAGRQGAACRSSWSSPRSSACTSTSPTSRGASPSRATWRSRPSCSCARATPRRYGDIAKLLSRGRLQGARRAGDGRPRRRVAWAAANGGDTAPARRHRLLLGRPHHLALRRAQPGGARPASPGTAGWPARPTPLSPRIRSTSPAALKAPVLGLYGGADTGIPLDTVEKMKARAGGGQRGGEALGVRRLSRGAARLPRRLPAELRKRPRGRLAALPRLARRTACLTLGLVAAAPAGAARAMTLAWIVARHPGRRRAVGRRSPRA